MPLSICINHQVKRYQGVGELGLSLIFFNAHLLSEEKREQAAQKNLTDPQAIDEVSLSRWTFNLHN